MSNKEKQHEEKIYSVPSTNKQYEVRTPKIDFYEQKNQYFIRISIPGVKKENLQIFFYNEEHLDIKGTVDSYAPNDVSRIITEEIYQGPFYRRIKVPKNINKQKLEFDYNRGILEVYLPKSEAKEVD